MVTTMKGPATLGRMPQAPVSVDAYIAQQPKAAQTVLVQVRSILRKALPQADELISYQIPTYKLEGGAVVYFAGWKKHFSLYPASERLVQAFEKELARYEVQKGTIRFPLNEPVPAKLIERIAKFRAKETLEHAEEKSASKKKAPAKESKKRASKTSGTKKPAVKKAVTAKATPRKAKKASARSRRS
jgi:uncharacterized protein YdhG (YjbR/CyaY superfamily)